MTTDTTLADQLLDAQVTFILQQLTGDRLQEVIERDTDEVLAIAADVRLDSIVQAADVTRVVRKLLAQVPPSVAASTLVQTGADLAVEGPTEPVALSQLISRDHVAAIVDEFLGLHPVAERALDRLTDSPAVGSLASAFITRIVVDVLQANRTVAEKIPGMGSIMSFGTSAASKVMSAADRPLQMVGDTANKGAAFAVRRLNAVVIDTLQDPLLRQAAMEVWDRHADDPIGQPGEFVTQEDARRIAGLVQEIVINGAVSDPVLMLVDRFIEAFFAIYGEYPVTTLLEELDISRDDILAELQVVVPRVIQAAREDGRLEDAIRTRLAPFFHSPAVTALLDGAAGA